MKRIQLRVVALCAALSLSFSLFVSAASAVPVTTNRIFHIDAGVGVNATGTNVNSWNDQSVSGETVTTNAGSPQLVAGAVNGLPAVEFTNDRLAGSNTSLFDIGMGDVTWAAVIRADPVSGNPNRVFGTLLNNSPWSGIGIDVTPGGNVGTFFRQNSNIIASDPTTAVGAGFNVFVGQRDGGIASLLRNGVMVAGGNAAGNVSGDAISIGTERTGGGEFFEGAIAELVIYDRALTGQEVFDVGSFLSSKYALPAPPAPPVPPGPGELYSVDIQAVGGVIARPMPGTYSGVEPIYGFGDVWNAFDVNGHTGNTTNQTLNLVDSFGNPSPVNFTVIDTVSGWSNNSAEVLVNDYLFVGVGSADASSLWEITGLVPGGVYEMYAYGGVGRDALITVDTDGDGDLSDETPTLVNAGGFLFADLLPDANGRILGEVAVGTAGNGEGNWSGFQLRATDLPAVVPEPASASLVLLGLGAAMMRSRRRRTR